jgi:hypothetical protein
MKENLSISSDKEIIPESDSSDDEQGDSQLWPTLNLSKGRDMAQDVSCWPLTAEARVRVRVNPCWICDGQSGIGTGFSPSSSVSPVNIIPPLLRTHL